MSFSPAALRPLDARVSSRVIDGLEGLHSLEENWRRLEIRAALPTQQFDWLSTATGALMRLGDPRIVVVENGGELRAAVPLFQRRGSAFLEMLGVADLHEPADAVWADDDALRRLAAAIVELRRPFYLRRIPARAPFAEALRSAFRNKGVLVERPDSPCPCIALDTSWIEPETKYGSKRRAYLRRARRLAEELGGVTAEVVTPTVETLGPLLDEAFAIEAANWKGKSGTALTMDPLRRDFYRRYAFAACEQGFFRLCFLRIGGRLAAMQLAIETCGRFWILKIGYDEKFSHCSPGSLLMRETIRHAVGRGLKALSLLGIMEAWKSQWTREADSYVALRGYPWGFRGGGQLAMDLAGFAWRRLFDKSGFKGPSTMRGAGASLNTAGRDGSPPGERGSTCVES